MTKRDFYDCITRNGNINDLGIWNLFILSRDFRLEYGHKPNRVEMIDYINSKLSGERCEELEKLILN